ncbi:urease accessory protein UreE [Bradyrhizobium sp. LHD-71]|uniref:urease accessory protein UreE n=1 Tax=Bradyrhizobium sp. LHD-71 TaxID=3072141 RepID=UPI00280EA5E4|nr:urease accessory protein UreE [Bradyrhizobium sp. LHD-71]MDQ8726981.1 urease accessory protein UreE [Bradyrhizobium sp. LHD-71]
MILIESVLGNARDAVWKDRLHAARIDWLVLDQWEAQKNRFRKHTADNVEIAVATDRNTHLHDGDILVWDENVPCAVVVKVELKAVMVIDLTQAMAQPPELSMRTCVELGHAIGNQHWPAIVKGNKVFVPLTLDQKVMSSVMRTYAFPGITYDFVPGAEVIPYLAPHEARRLFGGADSSGHAHSHHAHGHG